MNNVKKDSKIAIIGAGAAGLAAAEALKEQGYQNITIFEKTDRVGGQSLSLRYKTDDNRDIVYELGSLQPTLSSRMLKLLEKYSLHLGKIYAGNNDKSNLALYVILYSLEQHKITQNFSKPMLGIPANKLFDAFTDFLKLGFYLIKYRSLAKPGFQLTTSQLSDLCTPVYQWIDQNNFKVLEDNLKVLSIAASAFGNHTLINEIQVFILLKFIYECTKWPPSRSRYVNGVFKPIREGYQELWNRVAKDHRVIFNSNIEKIVRRDNKIYITEEGKSEVVFDKLLVSCALTQTNQFLDLTDEERNIFNKIRYNPGWRAAFLAKNLPHDGVYFFLEVSKKSYDCPITGFYAEGEVGKGVWLYSTAFTTATADPNSLETYVNRTEELLRKEFNAEDIKWINKTYWPEFFPHFNTGDIKNGIYEQLYNLQGKNNTYYLGGILSSNMHAPVIDYSYSIINKYF